MNIIIKNNIWTFDNFLNEDECEKFIKQIDEKKDTVNFTNADIFKNDKYIDNKLTKYFFDKIKNNLDIDILRPNNLIMSGKYVIGNKFGLHKDTGLHFDVIKREKSNYTLLIYLNDNFTGGNTIFYDDNFKEIASIKPKKGMALLFDISLWHKGCKLTEGEKYWIGCEIISKF